MPNYDQDRTESNSKPWKNYKMKWVSGEGYRIFEKDKDYNVTTTTVPMMVGNLRSIQYKYFEPNTAKGWPASHLVKLTLESPDENRVIEFALNKDTTNVVNGLLWYHDQFDKLAGVFLEIRPWENNTNGKDYYNVAIQFDESGRDGTKGRLYEWNDPAIPPIKREWTHKETKKTFDRKPEVGTAKDYWFEKDDTAHFDWWAEQVKGLIDVMHNKSAQSASPMPEAKNEPVTSGDPDDDLPF